MSREEIKTWIRIQINSCVYISEIDNKYTVHLCYNNSYLRALKLSKITGKPVNQADFKGGEMLFSFNIQTKEFWFYDKIREYLNIQYSMNCMKQILIIEEVIEEYEQYKGCSYLPN